MDIELPEADYLTIDSVIENDTDTDMDTDMDDSRAKISLTPTERTPIIGGGGGSGIVDEISAFDAIQHLIKGNLGPGVLNLPHAFALSGWVLGLILASVVALQGIYSMVLLVYCKEYVRSDLKGKRKLQQKHHQEQEQQGIKQKNDNEKEYDENSICSFMDVAYATHGKAGSITVQMLLFIMQGGVCCVFLSLIATNLHALQPAIQSDTCVLIVSGLLLIVVLVRDLKELKWLSFGGNCCMMTAILTASLSAMYVLYLNAHTEDDAGNNEEAFTYKQYTAKPAAIATFISSMFYSFEGIGLVMPIENSYVGYEDNHNGTMSELIGANDEEENNDNEEDELLRKESRVKSFINPVLIGAMCVVAFLFILIGVTCGPAFPDIIDGSVTAYLTTKYPDSLWYKLVDASVMVAVFLTFPLQLTPAMEVLQDWFGPGCNPCSAHETGCNGAIVKYRGGLLGQYEWIFRRYLVVFGCSIIVLTVNDLGLLMSLFGAVGNTGLAAMPCIIHLKLMRDERAPYYFMLWGIDVCTIIFAGAVAVTGVIFSLLQII